MKILYFSRDYTPHDHRILTSLVETGQRVFYLRLENSDFIFEERPLPPEIEQISWKKTRRASAWTDWPGMVLELKAIAASIKPDLVQAGPLQRSALLAALAGLHPLISMSWGYDLLVDADRNALWRQATRFVLSRSDLMIGDCDTIRQLAITYGMPNRRIVTFPWGIDLEHFSPQDPGKAAPNSDTGNTPKTFTLLSTRSWEPIYGIDTLVEAFLQLAPSQPDLHLTMLGNGSLAAGIKRRFYEAGLIPSQDIPSERQTTRVNFPGQVSFSALPGYYRSSDLYLSASHSDGTSISLLEAMACALPVLTSNIPGNREWVRPGENGWLFRDGDPSAMAAAILEAYQQRSYLAEMGRAARQTAEARADWKINFQKMLQAYQLVTSEN